MRYLIVVWGLLISLSGCSSVLQESWVVPCSGHFEFYPLNWEQLLILSSSCDSEPCIKAIDLRSGEEAWSLSDTLFKQVYYNFQPYLDERYLVLPVGRELICLSPKTGEILWQSRRSRSGDSHVFGDGQFVYRSYVATSDSAFEWIRFDLDSGRDSLLLMSPVSKASRCLMRSPVPFFDGRDSGLVSPVIDYEPRGLTESYLLLWKQEQSAAAVRHTIYPDNEQGRGPSLPPVVAGKHSWWVASQDVVSFDLANEKIVWRVTLPHGLLTSRLTLHGDNLFLACEDEKLYAIAASTGKLQWSSPIAGTPGRVFHAPEATYLIGGSDQVLYEIDRHKGQVLDRYAFQGTGRKLRRVAYFGHGVAVLNDGRNWQAVPLTALPTQLRRLQVPENNRK
ncbi:MAG: PQQ-binding-like beta-propeller repeat protein [Phaeodactylibacter sp.]|uniref:outer membrane protein assembly factor BamB family protein n=1 Tax=Phaeodactylibacter sp. TaxID=1940289 RepID=UPI0032EB9B6C